MANRLAAGSDLASYVFATARKGAMKPYVSAHTAGVAAIIAAAPDQLPVAARRMFA